MFNLSKLNEIARPRNELAIKKAKLRKMKRKLRQIATLPEQSQRLIAGGVDINTCDMFYKKSPLMAEHDSHEMRLFPVDRHTIGWPPDYPAWSLSRLLLLLPMGINDKGLQTTFQLDTNPDDSSWNAAYYDYAMDKYLRILCDKSPIEACVKAIEWLTKEGYKLNQI